MRTAKRIRHGLSSVLAMIYLTLMAALAVGFYTAIDTGSSISDNEQYIHRALTAAETGMGFARYQLAHVSIPGTTTSGNFLSALNTALQVNLTGANAPGITGSTIYIPAEVSGSPVWMPTDNLGDQAYIEITQLSGSTFPVQVKVYGQNSNSRNTPITRIVEMTFNSNEGVSAPTVPPIFKYGMVSYGEIFLNANVAVTGSSLGVMAVTAAGVNPIQDNSSGSIAGNFYWTNSVLEHNITWGSLSVDGYLPTSGQFVNHVFGNTAAPSPLVFDTSPFAAYVTAQTPASNATVINNASLASGTYTFNSPVTINGALYLQSGAKVTFNNTVTVNGAIVQANGATPPSGATVTFNGVVTQNSISTLGSTYSAGEKALTGTFLLVPNGSVIANAKITANDSVIADGLTVNANTKVAAGSVINLGSGNMTFNSASTLNLTTSSATSSPAGVTGIPAPFWYTTANVTSYSEPTQ